MKKRDGIIMLFLGMLFFISCCAAEVQADEKSLTLMVYMCGSNLESSYAAATKDLEEMMESGFNQDEFNLLVMTGGSLSWHTSFQAEGVNLSRVTDVIEGIKSFGEVSMGSPETLVDFLRYGVEHYKASNYALIIWDHGEGPLGGVCIDELNSPDKLSLTEITDSLEAANLSGKLSFIGFDACLMASAEVANALSPYADYLIASEEKEPEYGWNYAFLQGIGSGDTGEEIGRRIVDSYFEGHEDAFGLTLSCIDLSVMEALTESLNNFFWYLGRNMDESAYTSLSRLRTASAPVGETARGIENGYDLVDLRDLIEHYTGLEDNTRLLEALEEAVVYSRASHGLEEEIHGLSIYHPMYNKNAYRDSWQETYRKMDFCPAYQGYIRNFGEILDGKPLTDWTKLKIFDKEADFTGLELAEDADEAEKGNHYSLSLTPAQQENFSSAQLVILGSMTDDFDNGMYGSQLSAGGAPTQKSEYLFPVWSEEVPLEENGVLRTGYGGYSLYLADEEGNAVAGPVSYRRSEDGKFWYVYVRYRNESGNDDYWSTTAKVLYTYTLNKASGELELVKTEVYDTLTYEYTSRISFSEEAYTKMCVDRMAVKKPEGEDILPGMNSWEQMDEELEVELPLSWHLKLYDEQLSGTVCYATIQITDIQQNQYCTPLVLVQNPNLYDIQVLPRTVAEEEFEMNVYAVLDRSPVSPGLSVGLEIRNTNERGSAYIDYIDDFLLNGTRFAKAQGYWGRGGYEVYHIDQVQLTGLKEITELSFSLMIRDHVAHEDRKEVFTFQIDGASLDTLRGEEERLPLSEVTVDGINWQLMDLKRDVKGCLAGVLHVINDTEKSLFQTGYLAVNECVQLGDEIRVDVPTHTDAYVPFECKNRTVFSDSHLDGIGYTDQMCMDHLLERAGIYEIQSLKFFFSFTKDPVILFTLPEPVCFASRESIPEMQNHEEQEGTDSAARETSGQEKQRMLLEGKVSVRVDKVMVGDRDLCLSCTIRNETDSDIILKFRCQTCNGLTADETFDEFYLSAHTQGSFGYIWHIDSEKVDTQKEIRDLGFVFQYWDQISHTAHLFFPEGCHWGQEGGTNLSVEDFETDPVSISYFSQAAYHEVQPLEEETEVDFFIQVKEGYKADPFNPFSFYFEFQVINHAQEERTYHFDHFIVNDKRAIGTTVRISKVPPESFKSGRNYCFGYNLACISEITSFSCVMTITAEDGEEEIEVPLRWEIEGVDLSREVFLCDQPLVEKEESGWIYQILALEKCNEGSNIEELEILVCVRNESGYYLEGSDDALAVLLEGFGMGTERLSGIENGLEECVEFSVYYRADWEGVSFYYQGEPLPERLYKGGILQAYGLDEIRDFTFFHRRDVTVKGHDSSAYQTVQLSLNEPWPLSAPDEEERRNFSLQPYLLDQEAAVRISYLMMGDNGLGLTLCIKNQTSEWQKLEIFDPKAGEVPLRFYEYYHGEYDLPPGAILVSTIVLYLDEYLEYSGKTLEDIRLSFRCGGKTFEGIQIHSDLPIILGSGYLAGSEHLKVTGEGETNDELTVDIIEQMTYLPGFLRADAETGETYEFNEGDCTVSDLTGREIFLPAIKVENTTDEDVNILVAATVNGHHTEWDWITVEADDYHILYIDDDLVLTEKFDMTFYVNGRMVLSETLALLDIYKVGFWRKTGDYDSDGDYLDRDCYSEDLQEGEIYIPTMRLRNSSISDVTVNVSCVINGEDFTWEKTTVPPGCNWFFYCEERNFENPGTYDITFFIDGEQVCHMVQVIRKKTTHHPLWPDPENDLSSVTGEPDDQMENLNSQEEPGISDLLCLKAKDFVEWYNERLQEAVFETWPDRSQEECKRIISHLKAEYAETKGSVLYFDNEDLSVEMIWRFVNENALIDHEANQMILSMSVSLSKEEQNLLKSILAEAVSEQRPQTMPELLEWMRGNEYTVERRNILKYDMTCLNTRDYSQYLLMSRKTVSDALVNFEENWYHRYTNSVWNGGQKDFVWTLHLTTGGFSLDAPDKTYLKSCTFGKTQYFPCADGKSILYIAEEDQISALQMIPGESLQLKLTTGEENYLLRLNWRIK